MVSPSWQEETSPSRHLGHLLAAMVLPELQLSVTLMSRPQPFRNLDYPRPPALLALLMRLCI